MKCILGRTKCVRSACLAIVYLNQLEEKLGHRDIPNGPTLADPAKFNPRLYDRQIDRLLAAHKQLHAGLCKSLATLLHYYVDVDGTQAGHWELELASLIDSMDLPGCLANALAAVPEGPAGDQLLEGVRFDCRNNPWMGADHGRSCDRFTRPSGAATPPFAGK